MLLNHFDLIARFYDPIFGQHGAEALVRRTAAQPHHWLLDAGGGTGRMAQHFSGRVTQVCVLDSSPNMLRQNRQKGICSIQGEVEQIPCADHTFDRIIMVDAFHHLRDQQQAAGELWRVLRPGGRLVIQEPDIARLPVKLIAWGERLALMRSRFWSAPNMAALFSQNGESVHIEKQRSTVWIIVNK